MRALKLELDAAGICSKVRTSKTGTVSGGNSFSRGALYKMLSNCIYLGEIVHKDKSYPGEHDAIVDPELWEHVQALLNDNAVDRRAGTNAKDPSLLTGLIFDDAGNPLTPSHANKQGVRYRYYVGDRNDGLPTIRLPGREIEELVVGQVVSLLKDPARLFDATAIGDGDVSARRALLDRAKEVATSLGADDHAVRKDVVNAILSRISVGREAIDLSIDGHGLANVLSVDAIMSEGEKQTFRISCPYLIKRRGVETRLIVSNEITKRPSRPDPALIRAVAKAFVWNKLLLSGEVISGRSIARSENVTPRYIYKLLPLAHLAPDIVTMICEGRQPQDLTLDTLVYSDMPARWEDQRRMFGFPAI